MISLYILFIGSGVGVGGTCHSSTAQLLGLCFLCDWVTNASPLPVCGMGVTAQVSQPVLVHIPAGTKGNTPPVFHYFVSDLLYLYPEGREFRTWSHQWQMLLSRPGHGGHSLSQGHVSCVQQKLLPAVGAH